MAVFMINICTFNGCGITFPRLADLIQHIEDTHINYDPIVVEQKEASQPSCIPLSYILKFYTETSRREIQNMPALPEPRRRTMSVPKTPSVRSGTPTGSEVDDEDLMSQSEDSNESWTTVEEYSSEYILRYGSRIQNPNGSSGALSAAAVEKPFACPVPGCKKRYKNVNGIKYHSKNGHKKDGKVKKGYKCHCGKSYKTCQGLKNHSVSHHIANNQVSLASLPSTSHEQRPFAKATPNLVVTASQPLHTVDPADGNYTNIYDIKTKDSVTPFMIPKTSLSNLSILNKSLETTSQISNVHGHLGILTPNSTPDSSPVDKIKYTKDDRYSKVTVRSSSAPLTPLTPINYANEKMFVPPKVSNGKN